MNSRPLHFIWLLDGSGSMQAKGKMEALNAAIRQTVPAMQQVARNEPQAAIYVNAIRFADDARWMTERLTPVSEFAWQDMEAGGLTALGEALTRVADTFQPPLLSGRALPPILILVTDGLPTDDFQAGLDRLLENPWGRQSLRVAVALGRDGADPKAQEILRAFVSSDAPAPAQADDAEALADQLRRLSTTALRSICSPLASQSRWDEESSLSETEADGW